LGRSPFTVDKGGIPQGGLPILKCLCYYGERNEQSNTILNGQNWNGKEGNKEVKIK